MIAQRAKRYGCYISFGCYAKEKGLLRWGACNKASQPTSVNGNLEASYRGQFLKATPLRDRRFLENAVLEVSETLCPALLPLYVATTGRKETSRAFIIIISTSICKIPPQIRGTKFKHFSALCPRIL